MDYSFFDALIDAVFVINAQKGVVYCNESAAKLCDSSVKRLSKGKPIYDVIEFEDPSLFVMPSGEVGKQTPAPYTEIKFKLKAGKEGKVQIAIQPFKQPDGEDRWAVMVRDVTLEEVLHAKYHKQLEEKEVYIKKLEEAQSQLEAYSKNLEQMVEERTQEVKSANVMLNAIMNSLGQGFFVFDNKGVCANFYTRACLEILEGEPAGKKVGEVLRVEAKEQETFKMWLDSTFQEMLPFDSLKDLGPKQFPHSKGNHVTLDYYPLRGESGSIERIVVVATDETAQFMAQQALEKEKRFAKMVVKLVTSKRQFGEFVTSSGKTIDQVIELAQKADSLKNFDHALYFRILHTLEGEAGTYSVSDVWQKSRDVQQVIEPLKRGENVEFLDVKATFMAALNELKKSYLDFLEQNKELFGLVGIGQKKIEVDRVQVEKLVADLTKRGVPASICQSIEDLLLKESVVGALRHFNDAVVMVAQRLNKVVNPIAFSGEDVRVFLDRYDTLFSTFVHAFRNIVDHGIEEAAEREMVGKPAAGQIAVHVARFEATDDGQWLRIVIEDDGRGVSVEKLREKIAQADGAGNVSALSDDDVVQYIFSSGVSTKEQIGEFSGRGIGLNAVKAEAESLGGNAWAENKPGKGLKIVIEVPDLDRVDRLRRSAQSRG